MTIPLIKRRIEQFVERQGRRPRILVSNMGQKNHDHDTKLLAAVFAESGFDVDISPQRQTPRGTARMAIENDVHLICFLSTENNHGSQIDDLLKALKAQHAQDIKIIMGGAIPRADYTLLYDAGVALVLNSLPADAGEINQLLDLFET
jgi:methylmalonyl-CoA mutase